MEFCEATRRYKYVGLCYGTPGVGKTLSARRFSRADLTEKYDPTRNGPVYESPLDTAFHTAGVVNSPAAVTRGVSSARECLTAMARSPVRTQAQIALNIFNLDESARFYRAQAQDTGTLSVDLASAPQDPLRTSLVLQEKARLIGDPTTLVIIDEADRLRTDSLEQARSLFDEGGIGLVLIGMPGLEKRMARYPQLYSRVGFVHQFEPLNTAEMRRILHRHWTPRGVTLPFEPWSEEASAAILRITGGNLRPLSRLLSQTERVLEPTA